MSDEKLDKILEKTIRIETALWPDEGQPSILTKHEERLKSLEGWRYWLAGAWSLLATIVGIKIGTHHGG